MVNDTTSTLPKPITMTGSAFEDKVKKKEKVEDSKVVVEDVKKENEELDELPMPAVFGDDDSDDNTVSDNSDDNSNNTKITDDSTSDDDDDTSLDDEKDEEVEEEKPLRIDVPETSDEKEENDKTEKSINSASSKAENEVPELILDDDSDEENTVLEKHEEFNAPKFSLNSDDEVLQDLPKEEVEVKPLVTNEPKELENDESTFEIPKLDNSVNLESRRDDVASDVKVIEGQQSNFRPPTVPAGTSFGNDNSSFSSSMPYMQRSTQPIDNRIQENKGGVPKVVLGILGVFIGGGLVVGGYFTANKIFNKGEEQIAQQTVSEPVASPVTEATKIPVTPIPAIQTPVPAVEEEVEEENLEEAADNKVKKEDLTIKILNGNGEKGVAKVVRALLVKEGFTDVKTGNAENFDYKKSYISYKPEYEDFVDEISAALEDKYTLIKDEELKDSDDYDFYIILGPEEEVKTEE